MPTNTQELSKATFKANPAQWRQSTDLRLMLSLLHYLANDSNVTVALLAADFAERTTKYAGANKDKVTRCVTAVRTWAHNPTDTTLQECKDAAANAAYVANDTANAARQTELQWQLAHVRKKHPLTEL